MPQAQPGSPALSASTPSSTALSAEARRAQWLNLQARYRRLPAAAIQAAALLAALALTSSPLLHAQSPQLAAIYSQMDAASKRFQNATASVERDNYEKVVRDTTVEKGTVYFDRSRTGMEFGATVYPVDAAGKPSATPSRVLSYSNGTLQMYTPSNKQVDLFKSGANQSKVEGYFALGFGGTSQALTSSWNVTDAGPETLTDNGQPVKTEKLVLVSKDPGVQSTFKQITLWLDPTRDVSLKQVFDTPSGDRQTATYTDIKVNTRVNTAPYKIPTKGVTVVPH